MDEVENDAKRRNISKPTSNFEIPKTCKAGVVVDPGDNFSVKIEEVPVPEPSLLSFLEHVSGKLAYTYLSVG